MKPPMKYTRTLITHETTKYKIFLVNLLQLNMTINPVNITITQKQTKYIVNDSLLIISELNIITKTDKEESQDSPKNSV